MSAQRILTRDDCHKYATLLTTKYATHLSKQSGPLETRLVRIVAPTVVTAVQHIRCQCRRVAALVDKLGPADALRRRDADGAGACAVLASLVSLRDRFRARDICCSSAAAAAPPAAFAAAAEPGAVVIRVRASCRSRSSSSHRRSGCRCRRSSNNNSSSTSAEGAGARASSRSWSSSSSSSSSSSRGRRCRRRGCRCRRSNNNSSSTGAGGASVSARSPRAAAESGVGESARRHHRCRRCRVAACWGVARVLARVRTRRPNHQCRRGRRRRRQHHRRLERAQLGWLVPHARLALCVVVVRAPALVLERLPRARGQRALSGGLKARGLLIRARARRLRPADWRRRVCNGWGRARERDEGRGPRTRGGPAPTRPRTVASGPPALSPPAPTALAAASASPARRPPHRRLTSRLRAVRSVRPCSPTGWLSSNPGVLAGKNSRCAILEFSANRVDQAAPSLSGGNGCS